MHTPPPRAESRRWLALQLLLVAGLGALYAITLLPGVGASDTAEFQLVGAVAGIPHGPGYPLYTALLVGWNHLCPWGSAALKANLLSALCALGAALYLAHSARRLGARAELAIAIAACFGLGRALWSQAVAAEVYALHALLLAGALHHGLAWQLARAAGQRARGQLLACCACFGAACAHHPLTLYSLPALAVLLGFGCAWRAALGNIALLGLGCALGLSAHLLLLWRWQDPELAFSAMRVDSLERLAYYLSGYEFRARMFALPLRELLGERLPALGRALAFGVGLPLVLAPLGLARARAGVRAALALALLGPLAHALFYDIPDIEPYFLPSVQAAALAAAAGAAALPSFAGWKRARVAAAAALAPLLALALDLRACDRSADTAAAQRCASALDAIGSDAIVIAPDSGSAMTMWYVLLAEGRGRERNVQLLLEKRIDALRDYLLAGQPLWERCTRRWLPAGLTVWVADEATRRQLDERGFQLAAAGGGLWKLLGAPPRADGSPAAWTPRAGDAR